MTAKYLIKIIVLTLIQVSLGYYVFSCDVLQNMKTLSNLLVIIVSKDQFLAQLLSHLFAHNPVLPTYRLTFAYFCCFVLAKVEKLFYLMSPEVYN